MTISTLACSLILLIITISLPLVLKTLELIGVIIEIGKEQDL